MDTGLKYKLFIVTKAGAVRRDQERRSIKLKLFIAAILAAAIVIGVLLYYK
jgi:hypothetical protein